MSDDLGTGETAAARADYLVERRRFGQALLPFAFEAARHQAVVGIDGAVAALGAARFVACPLDAETPLPERGLAIGLEPLRGRRQWRRASPDRGRR